MILFLGYTVAGSQHDYSLFKQEFDPALNWFEQFKIWLDLGYLGIKADYQALEINIPHKKPRKSKANPGPSLTSEQKSENQQMSRRRIVVEHAICRMKRFRSVTALFRNRKKKFVDDVAVITAALSNWMLVCQTAA